MKDTPWHWFWSVVFPSFFLGVLASFSLLSAGFHPGIGLVALLAIFAVSIPMRAIAFHLEKICEILAKRDKKKE